MAKRNTHSYERNKREQARQARAAARRARKRARASDGGQPESDIVASPQYREKPSDDEVQAAIERAMNPGAARREVKRAPTAEKPTGRRIFVGNLDFGIEEAELSELFRDKGFNVVHTRLVRDRETGRPRGFAFIDLSGPEEAARAIETFDGAELAGRALRVNPAEQR